jgi:drug/metabolite transporter (DMT)-like permease
VNTPTATPHSVPREIALLFLLALLWGSSYVWIKLALETIPPATLMASRTVLGCALLYAAMRAKGLHFGLARGLSGPLLVQSLFNCTLSWLALAWGQQYLPTSTAGVLNSTSPLFVVVLSLVVLRKWVTREVLGAVIGFLGVALVLGVSFAGDVSHALGAKFAMLFGGVCYAISALIGKRFASVPALVTTTGMLMWAAVAMVPIALVVDQPWKLAPSWKSLGAVVMLGVFSTAIAMTLYFRLLKTLGSLGVASQAYLRAGITVMLGLTFMAESLTLPVFFGLLLIILSVVMINLPTRARRKVAA